MRYITTTALLLSLAALAPAQAERAKPSPSGATQMVEVTRSGSLPSANGMDRRFPISLVERINCQEPIQCRRTRSQPNPMHRSP